MENNINNKEIIENNINNNIIIQPNINPIDNSKIRNVDNIDRIQVRQKQKRRRTPKADMIEVLKERRNHFETFGTEGVPFKRPRGRPPLSAKNSDHNNHFNMNINRAILPSEIKRRNELDESKNQRKSS
jgi:hypothetical protein